jgi:aminotransferase
MKAFNVRLKSWDDSAILELFRSENMGRRENIDFGIGEMGFPTPPPIVDACKDALDQGVTFYMPTFGAPELRRVLAEASAKEYGLSVTEDQIFVTPGGTNAVYTAILSVVAPGEEVLYPNPGFPAYLPQVILADGNPVGYPLVRENGFVPDPDDIKSRLTRKTKLLILNSPSNPIGNIIPADRLEAIARIAVERDLWVLSDEAYKHIVYPPEAHKSIVGFPGMKERTLIACSFSKSFSMTGWRIGYIIGPPGFGEVFFKVFQYTVTCVSSFSQMAAIRAVQEGDTCHEKILSQMIRRKNAMERGLSDIPYVTFPRPQGAFYIFLDVKRLGLSSVEISKKLLNDFSVVTIPGSAFGECGEGFLRLSFATGEDRIAQGLVRLKRAMEVLGRL